MSYSVNQAGAKPISLKARPPVVYWARAGVVIAVFIAWVLGRWMLGPNFKPTDPGPDPITGLELTILFWVQAITVILGVVTVWLVIVRPWMREGQMTTAGMLYTCWLTLFFQDPMMNYTSAHVLYNSYMVNMGTWTLGSTPGWTSPNGNNLPEPLLLIILGYSVGSYCLVFPVIAILNKIRDKKPAISKVSLAVIGIGLLICMNTIFEASLLRTGAYAYPGGIREITLFAGQPYQFPMTEGLFFGGFTIGSTMLLLFFRDDKGQTFVEKGIETLHISQFSRQWVKFFALFAFVHGSMFLVFTIPMQWMGTHSDPYPEYPSYMINGLCAYGETGDQCPGPGVMMPRPENNPF